MAGEIEQAPAQPGRPGRRGGWLLACVALWLAASAAGLWTLWKYDNAPGAVAQASAHWPAASRLVRATDRPTLVLLAHPQCTCTPASISELAEILARVHNGPRTYVVFLKPSQFPDGWERTPLWQSATRLPNVSVVRDDDGREAEAFGARTSGQTMLYDAAGSLQFSGGITMARGHAGDNAGRQALVSLIDGLDTPHRRTSVFGCPLFAAAR